MTPDEAAELLASRGVCLGPDAMARLIERTEGWPAGLYLATLYLEAETEPDSAIERFSGDHRLVADYLHDEFLSTLSAEDADFMIRSSILDRLSGEVCDAVLGCEGSAARLRRLASLEPAADPARPTRPPVPLPCAAAGDARVRARRPRGPPGTRATRPRERLVRARRSSLIGPSPHAIAAGDTERAGALIWARTASYASRGRVATLRDWLALLGGQATAASPTLSLTQATVDLSRGDGALVDALGRHRARAAQGPRRFRTVGARGIGAADPRRRARRATESRRCATTSRARYEHLPEDSPWRSLARLIDGVSSHLAGDREQARKLLEEGIASWRHRCAEHRGAVPRPARRWWRSTRATSRRRSPWPRTRVAQTKRYGLDATPTSALILRRRRARSTRRRGRRRRRPAS